MAVDDILWKNVEALKSARPSAASSTPGAMPKATESISASRKDNRTRGNGVRRRRTVNGVNRRPQIQLGDNHDTQSLDRVQANGRTGARSPESVERLFDQLPTRPAQRRPERYAFQFWTDQITRLRKLRQTINLAKDPEDRTEVTLSDLVRKAVDDYLDKQTGLTSDADRDV